MPRIRSIKPEWLEDERLAACGDTARMMSVALITLADDHGNGRAHPMYLGSRIWPCEEDLAAVSRKLAASLGELAESEFISIYEVKSQRYYHINNWSKHQRIDNAGKPLVPLPSEAAAGSPRTRGGSPLETDQETDQDQERESPLGEVAATPKPSPPDPNQDPLESFAAAWRELTGRSEFSDGCGQYTGTELAALKDFRKACGGSVAEFRRRVSARLAGDRNDFNLSQSLIRWSTDMINVPAAPPRPKPPQPKTAPSEGVRILTEEERLDGLEKAKETLRQLREQKGQG